jgi:hypothetical protein
MAASAILFPEDSSITTGQYEAGVYTGISRQHSEFPVSPLKPMNQLIGEN